MESATRHLLAQKWQLEVKEATVDLRNSCSSIAVMWPLVAQCCGERRHAAKRRRPDARSQWMSTFNTVNKNKQARMNMYVMLQWRTKLWCKAWILQLLKDLQPCLHNPPPLTSPDRKQQQNIDKGYRKKWMTMLHWIYNEAQIERLGKIRKIGFHIKLN